MTAPDDDWPPLIYSSVACPEWCQLAAGHPYLIEPPPPGFVPDLVRAHRARLAGEEPTGVEVWITQSEHALTASGPVLRDEVEARLHTGLFVLDLADTDDPPPLDADGLRDVGSMLHRAAATLAAADAPQTPGASAWD